MIRQLTEADLPDVLWVQERAYIPALLESTETFARKMRLFPQGALGWVEERLVAYVFFHPWMREQVVPLGDKGLRLPERPYCIYIHDLAVIPAARGCGIARDLLNTVFKVGGELDIRDYELVAVQSSESFWRKYGFIPVGSFEYAPGVVATRMAKAPSN